jgi:hypothetical protein
VRGGDEDVVVRGHGRLGLVRGSEANLDWVVEGVGECELE